MKNKAEIIALIKKINEEVKSHGFTRNFWEALSKFTKLLFTQLEIREKYAYLDIYEYIQSIPTRLKKPLKDITDDEIYTQILHLPKESFEWNCYVPLLSLRLFPSDFILGNGRLIISGDMPKDIKDHLKCAVLETLPTNTFLATKVTAGGPHKAIELALEQAIQAMGILQKFSTLI